MTQLRDGVVHRASDSVDPAERPVVRKSMRRRKSEVFRKVNACPRGEALRRNPDGRDRVERGATLAPGDRRVLHRHPVCIRLPLDHKLKTRLARRQLQRHHVPKLVAAPRKGPRRSPGAGVAGQRPRRILDGVGPSANGVWLQYLTDKGLSTFFVVARSRLTSSRTLHWRGSEPTKNCHRRPSVACVARIT